MITRSEALKPTALHLPGLDAPVENHCRLRLPLTAM
jgi:hypothetical protein